MSKIINYNDLKKTIAPIKTLGKLVLLGGCFDILHLGHIRFLENAKKYGTTLVALESDATLKKLKGTSRPIHSQKDRAEVLSHLQTVDYIILLPEFQNDSDYENLTKTVSPSFIALTEGDPLLSKKQAQAGKIGAQIIVVPKINTPSTSQLAKLLDLE